MTRDELLEKIRKVEALYSGTSFDGEKQAAHAALARLHKQLQEAPPPVQEFKFSLPDPWKRQLFLALVRRHGLTPYRLPRQRRTTVMVRLSPELLDNFIWPEFNELSRLLHTYLSEATEDIIARAIHKDMSDADEAGLLP
jgi:hypothetical protein